MKDKIEDILIKYFNGGIRDFSKKVGVSHTLVKRWLTGEINPTLKSQQKIIIALGLPKNYFKKDVKKTFDKMSKGELLIEIGKLQERQNLSQYFIDQIGYFKDLLINRDRDIIDIKEKCDLMVRNHIKKTPRQSS